MANIISPVDDNPDAPGGFGFTEYKESGDEEFDYQNGIIRAIRIFDGPWENRYDFINSFSAQYNSVNGQQIYIPAPSHPTIKGACVVKANTKGYLQTDKDDVNNIVTHTMARVTLTYETPKYNFNKSNTTADPRELQRFFIEESLESSTEIYALDADGVKIDGKNIALAGVKKFPLRLVYLNYRLTFPFIFEPRFSYVGIMSGLVNSTPFVTPSGLIAPPGCLLFDGISGITKREIFEGLLVWQITYNFTFFKDGWNYQPTVDRVNNKIVWKLLDPPLYKEDEFRRLFFDITVDQSNSILALWARYQFTTLKDLQDALDSGLITRSEYEQLLILFGIYLN